MIPGDSIHRKEYGEGRIITVWPDGSVTALFDSPPGMVKLDHPQVVPVVRFVPEAV
jgi:hypothetical protein